MKKYFLYFAKHPIWYNIVIYAIVMSVIWSHNTIFSAGAWNNYQIIIPLAILILHIILIYVVIEIYITRPKSTFSSCSVIMLDDNRATVLDECVWGKKRRYAIEFPRDIDYWKTQKFIVDATIVISHSTFTFRFPISLCAEFDYPFNRTHIIPHFDTSIADNMGVWKLEKYVRNLFYTTNGLFKKNDDRYKKFQEIIRDFYEGEDSSLKVRDRLFKAIQMPKNIIPGTEITNITVHKPDIICGGKN